MSEDAEKRFDQALDRLFSSPASSTAGATTSSKERRKGVPTKEDNLVGPRFNSTLRSSGRPPRVSGSSSLHAVSTFNSQSVCRPWDRGDLFRRLATFKSMTWFGKPEEAGPVNCARKGWVNVDVDLIACEGCRAKLSFPSPTTWSQQQVESAAASFSEKLDSAHKALCPWKGNACSETLAQFPPTPVEALMEGFRDRCDALLQLSTLPAISNSAIDHLKSARGPQIDHLLAQPVPAVTLSIEIPKTGTETGSCTYFQAQRLISLCGWEPRLLPYIVDCDDESTLSAVRSSCIAAHDEVKVRRHSDPGPTVLLCPRTERLEEKANKDKFLYTEPRSNVGSAVLDCSLCGASVGLWLFSQVHRPSILTSTQSAGIMKTGSAPSACGFSAASGIERGCSDDHERKENIEKHDEGGDAVTSILAKSVPRAGVLDLKLTIAGGPTPTQLNPPGLRPSIFSPNPFTQPGISVSARNEMEDHLISNVLGDSECQGHADKVRSTGDKPMSITFHADTPGPASLNNHVADKSKNSLAESGQRELASELSPALAGFGIEKEGDGRRTWKRKRNEHSIIEDLPRYSSVDAMDTCFHSRRENSTESVEMPQEADSQGTAISGENNDRVAQAQQSTYGQAIGRHEKSPMSSKDERVARDEGNDNISTLMKSSVSKKVSKTVDIGHRKYDGKCGQETEVYHDEQTVSRSVAETSRNYKVASETISEEERQAPEVVGARNQGGVHSAHPKQRIGSVNNVSVIEGNSGDSGGKQEENERQLVLLDERMCGGEAKKPFTPNAVAESSTGAMTGEERIFDSGMLWEKEPKEFDPLLQHRHFCPWGNANFMKLRSRNDNQYGGMCGWQLTLDALEASPVNIESESASSIYNADPLSSVRKILGRTQRSQQKSKNS